MRKSNLKPGFTLIELLVVIAIVGILSGIIIVATSNATSSATVAKAQVFSNSLRNSLSNNLVSVWKFDEGTGQAVADSWGTNGNTLGSTAGVDAYDPAWTTSGCVYGNCLSFDGVNDYFNPGSGTTIQNQDFTLEFWANPSSIESGYSGVIGTSGYSSNAGFGFYANSNNLYSLWFGDGTTLRYISNVFTMTVGWGHYAVSKSGTTVNVYKNGQIVNSGNNTIASATISYTSTNWYIGQSINVNYNFLGLIDEVRMYSAPIPTSQIKEHYLAGLNSLLAQGEITKQEYNQRLANLNQSYAKNNNK